MFDFDPAVSGPCGEGGVISRTDYHLDHLIPAEIANS